MTQSSFNTNVIATGAAEIAISVRLHCMANVVH